MKARNSLGEDYECKHDWGDTSVQCGDSGIVFSKPENYITAFFEAFPKKPTCFLRGEGSNVEEAELNCWNKYQKVLTCNHEMERRNRRDGYGYCKHCAYSSMVFEPLDKCCKCGTPTRWQTDYKGNHYCQKHSRNIPKNPNPRHFDIIHHRVPRKYKKLLKKAATKKFINKGIIGSVKMKVGYFNSKTLTCNNKSINLLFKEQEKKLLKQK